MRDEVIKCIESKKIIAIVRGVEGEKLIPLAEAMYDGGIRLLEITYSADGKVSDGEIAGSIKTLSAHFKNRMYIGAGTVLTEEQAELTYEAGGSFVISPDTCPEVIKRTRELGLVSIPGALTPTEIQSASKYGADFVKIFPAACVGTGYVKAVRAPLCHIKLLAVGGINEGNIREYLKAGVCGFGIGSNIIDKKALMNNDFRAITELSKRYVSEVNMPYNA